MYKKKYANLKKAVKNSEKEKQHLTSLLVEAKKKISKLTEENGHLVDLISNYSKIDPDLLSDTTSASDIDDPEEVKLKMDYPTVLPQVERVKKPRGKKRQQTSQLKEENTKKRAKT